MSPYDIPRNDVPRAVECYRWTVEHEPERVGDVARTLVLLQDDPAELLAALEE